MSSSCTPRARYTERETTQQTARDEATAIRAQLIADGERKSLDDPDRPAVLHPETWPEEITVRIVHYVLPASVAVELGPDPADQTSWNAGNDPEAAMAGAETALAALGYTLDRFRMYQDMALTVGRFYRKAGPYA